MKKIISVGLALITVLLSLTACALKNPSDNTPKENGDKPFNITIGPRTIEEYKQYIAERQAANVKEPDPEYHIGKIATRTCGDKLLYVPGFYVKIPAGINESAKYFDTFTIISGSEYTFPEEETEKGPVDSSANQENMLETYTLGGVTYDLEFSSFYMGTYSYRAMSDGQMLGMLVFDEDQNLTQSLSVPVANVEITKTTTPEEAVYLVADALKDFVDFSSFKYVIACESGFSRDYDTGEIMWYPSEPEGEFNRLTISFYKEEKKLTDVMDQDDILVNLSLSSTGVIDHLLLQNIDKEPESKDKSAKMPEDIDVEAINEIVIKSLKEHFTGKNNYDKLIIYYYDTLKLTGYNYVEKGEKPYLCLNYQLSKVEIHGSETLSEKYKFDIYVDLSEEYVLSTDHDQRFNW